MNKRPINLGSTWITIAFVIAVAMFASFAESCASGEVSEEWREGGPTYEEAENVTWQQLGGDDE